MAESTEFVEYTNAYIHGYIRFADTKAGAIATLAAAFPALSATILKSAGAPGAALGLWVPPAMYLAGAIAAICFCVVLIRCLSALRPRGRKAEGSLASFPDIAKLSSGEYVSQVSRLETLGRVAELAKHNHALSCIAVAKFRNIECAVAWLYVGLPAFLVFNALALLAFTREAG